MTLLDVAAQVARNIGIKAPNPVVGTDDPNAVMTLQFINETGQELARRVDWSGLRRTHLISGTGFNGNYDLPKDFARMVQGWGVTALGQPVRGGLTGDEWNAITPALGTPRYFQTAGQRVHFHPYPPEGMQITLSYISKNWTSADNDVFGRDTETALFPESLLAMGATWRYLRRMKADYSDYLAEYEAALADLARADEAARLP